MMLRIDEAACVSEDKTEAMCSECVRNIDMVGVKLHQLFAEFEITDVKNFKTKTKTTKKCSGFWDKT